MTEQNRKTARRSDNDRRTEHRTVHRRKSNVPVDVENRSNLDQGLHIKEKKTEDVERRH